MQSSEEFNRVFDNEEKFYSFKNSTHEVTNIIKDNCSK